MLQSGPLAVERGIMVDIANLLLGALALVTDKGEGAGQVRREVLGVGEKVGKGSVHIWIGGRLAAE